MKTFLIRAEGVQPYFNQAIEATLLDLAVGDTQILYLWQNDKTVFIGKNQNAYTECRVPVIEADNGFIARRISGGGAVYHDKGNLNFTFLSSPENYSVGRNFGIMTSAIKSLGFAAELNGRNDVVIDGKKFSGNAFYRGRSCFHHGTVLICANRDKLSKYLSVGKAKLEAKGVKSVTSRVVNLSELDPSVTADKVADALIGAFNRFYGAKAQTLTADMLDEKALAKNVKFFSDERWRLGDNVHYDAQTEARFEWGTADIRLGLNKNTIVRAKIYSDCLDPDEVAKKEALLVGADLYLGKEGVNDIIEAFKEQKNGF